VTPNEARNMYRDQMVAHGGTFVLSRGAATANVRGRILASSSGPATDTVEGRVSRAVILAEDVEAASFPGHPERGDVLDGRMVMFCDPEKRKIGDTLIAYELEIAA